MICARRLALPGTSDWYADSLRVRLEPIAIDQNTTPSRARLSLTAC
jgi:hypothetical protein